MTALDFRDPPRACRRLEGDGRHHRYVRTSTSSLDLHRAADWETPTALTFQTETITAQVYGSRMTYARETPVPPMLIVQGMQRMWAKLRAAVTTAGMVVDADEVLGVTIDGDPRRHEGHISVRVKCWPAVEGVTTPRQDSTW